MPAVAQPPAVAVEPRPATDTKVVIAHDWLIRYAGSERVVEALLDLYPDALLITTLVSNDGMPASLSVAEPSFLQRIPHATRRHEWLLPLMPAAWRLRRPIHDVDVVISSSHACAKSVRISPGVPHVCYCHTPMRYAWMFDEEQERFPRFGRTAARVLMAGFRRWDRSTSDNVSTFVANSSAVAERIRLAYGRESRVIHPPVRTQFYEPGEKVGEYFLYIGRLVAYKRPGDVVDLFSELEDRLVVVGEGHLEGDLRRRATPNVDFRRNPSDEELRSLYRGALALVFLGNEDFGIVMAEAQACGTPVIATKEGGALDIVQDGVTGWLVDPGDHRAIIQAVDEARSDPLDRTLIAEKASRFSVQRFRDEIDAVVRDAAG